MPELPDGGKVSACPCNPLRTLAACCGPYHAGTPAPDAESLMRSRYSAYVLGLTDYLLATWHSSTRPAAETLLMDKSLRWLGLEIRRTKSTGSDRAQVEFIAKYKDGGFPAQRLHECSDFILENGCWFYLGGTFR